MADWSSIPKSYKSAWLVLLAGLLATGYFVRSVKSDIDLNAQRQFASDCAEIQLKIEGRLQAHKQVLLGGAALFDASDNVSRSEWHAYAKRMEIDQHFNGIQGLGFSLWIPGSQLAKHVADIRRQGFPGYSVYPAGERDAYSSIIYLEPFKDRNLRAFGYDMYSEPVRRAAMEQARDEDAISLSGKVKLVQETGKDVQAGTLMYVPVYRKAMPLENIDERRAALYGWVYSPFRMSDLLHGVLKTRETHQNSYLRLRVYDGLNTNTDSLLYSSNDGEKEISPQVAFTLERHLDFNGRKWNLHFDLLNGSIAGIDYSKAWVILAGGMSLSILSFFLMLSYLNTRRNAARIADELTLKSRKASRYARSLIEASLDPLVTISPEGKITDVNEGSIKVTGMSREKLIGTDFSDYFTEPAKAREGYQRVFAKGFVTDYPLTIRRADGKLTDVLYNASVYRDEAGVVQGVFAAARDVTERNNAEAAVRESEALLQTIMKILPVGLWFIDANGNISFSNDAAQRIWAGVKYLGIAQLGGYKGWWFDSKKPVGAHEWAGARALERGETSMEEEIEIECFDGTHKIILDSAVPLRKSDGSIHGAITINQDITERKHAEEELRRYKDHLEEEVQQRTTDLVLARDAAQAANQAKSVFLANMSHELRTPLNAILGFSNIMRHSPQMTDEEHENLEIINRSGEHLLTLINDVLEMAKIEAGRVQLENAPFDLGALLRDVTDMMHMRAQEKGLQLLIDQSSEFPRYIRGDEARVRQVLINLIGNAIKFTRQGGVTVRLGTGKDSRLMIEVEDSGIGIPAEDLQRIFEPFVQVGDVAAQKGTGLGLAITRQFVQLMGGSIRADSTPGVGSVFCVELPLERVEATDVVQQGVIAKGEVVALAPNQPEYRILIVEDQMENQLLLTKLMKKLGLPVKVAENGEQAVSLFSSWQPHLIWMDRRMPVMDGLEATRRIRKLPGGRDVKIVAVTASVFVEQRNEILNADMDDFVRKPYRFNEIYECLTRQLGVQYVYATEAIEEKQSEVVLTPDMLAVLSEELKRKLGDALESLDSERIAGVIEQIADSKLKKVLTHLADNFAYQVILTALQANQKEKVA